jgi:hypothetical protein
MEYDIVRARAAHLVAHPGDRLPLKGMEATFVSAGGGLITRPFSESTGINSACTNLEDYPEDGTENYRSVGVLFKFGRFRFFDPGDLSGNTLTQLACPRDRIGPVSAYLISHHGDYDTAVPSLYAALQPQVAIMNNGVVRGGNPDALKTVRAFPSTDLWQLHRSQNDGAENAPDDHLANVDDGTQTSYALRLAASDDGSFTVTNPRTGFVKRYEHGGARASRRQ